MPGRRAGCLVASRGGPVADGCTGERSDEEGSGTINSVGLIVVAAAFAVVLGGVGVAHRERVRLQVARIDELALEIEFRVLGKAETA